MAVQLQLPIRPRGEPVVVVAIQHDRRVRADARCRQECAEVLAARDVATDAVGELAGPVPADRSRQVALVVGGRVDIDLDEADRRVVETGLRPGGVDEGVAGGVSGAHGIPSCVRRPRGRGAEVRWAGSSPGSRLGLSRRTLVGRGG